jgi:glucosamine--fructose-6-phosphate aminotransferase (isomerizing)
MMTINNDSPYLSDILTQATALHGALARFNPQPLEKLAHAFDEGRFDRIILTGMGASFFALYPTYLHLARRNLPVMWVDTAELLHYAKCQITERSLVWIVSQSGRSAEILSLLELLDEAQSAGVLAFSNNLDSPLAEAVSQSPAISTLMPIDAEPETTVSTRTYMNSLALCQLAARSLYREDLTPSMASVDAAIDPMAAYLADWQAHLAAIGSAVGKPEYMVILGRGPSLASVYCGALVLGEAGSIPSIGMPAGQFRHGPLEMCAPNLTVILFAGPPETRRLNERLARDAADCGANVFWLGPEIEGVTTFAMPAVEGIGLPLAETLPIQLLTVHLARQAGRVPGKFKHIGKVTLKE